MDTENSINQGEITYRRFLDFMNDEIIKIRKLEQELERDVAKDIQK